jgi:hypothetical protein
MELRTTPRSLLRPKEWPDGPDAKPIYVVVEMPISRGMSEWIEIKSFAGEVPDSNYSPVRITFSVIVCSRHLHDAVYLLLRKPRLAADYHSMHGQQPITES